MYDSVYPPRPSQTADDQESLTMLEVREGSDFPRFRERIQSRLEVSGDGCWAAWTWWRTEGSRRYFPEKQRDTFELSFMDVLPLKPVRRLHILFRVKSYFIVDLPLHHHLTSYTLFCFQAYLFPCTKTR